MPIPWWSDKTISMKPESSDLNSKTYRFCLEGCEKGSDKACKPLIVIALNPSTADETEPDNTMKRVVPCMEANGFDGFVMLNLYPFRATDPLALKGIVIEHEIHKKNLETIGQKIKEVADKIKTAPTILLTFGTNIMINPKLKDCFKDIVKTCEKYNPRWTYLKKTKDGHPGHILFLTNGLKLSEFDVGNYLNKLFPDQD